jgi:DNA adenine methylase
MSEWIEQMIRDNKKQEREQFVRAPFPWPGGKYESLRHIIPILPKANTFIEPCGGSGVVTINLPFDYPLKVFNDRHSGITAFFRCMRDFDKKEAVRKLLTMSVHSREDFVWCRDTWENCTDDVERAYRWFYMMRTSFATLGRNWGRSTAGRSMIAQKLYNGLELLDTCHRVFRNIQIENLDCVQCIKDYDSLDTVGYVDPPYIDSDQGIYTHGVEHKALLETIFESKGWYAVSGYKHDLYEKYPWDEKHEWPVTVKLRAKSFKDNHLEGKENVMGGHDSAIECLYIKDFTT